MKKNTVITIPKNITSLSCVKGLPLHEKKTILIYGGLGALPDRFLGSGFEEVQHLFRALRCIAIDKAHPVIDKKKIDVSMNNSRLPWCRDLPYAALDQIQLNNNNSLLIGKHSLSVDGVITAVPTVNHFKISEQWASRGAFVWIEKPIIMIHEVSQIRHLSEQYPRIFASDFLLDSDAMVWFLKHQNELMSKIGKVHSIHGRLIESWSVEKELHQRVWLLNPEISGGGLGFDLTVHQLAMFSPILEGLGLKLRDVEITDVIMGSNIPSLPVETALWCKGHVGDLSIFCDSGKGLEDTYSGITIIGEQGSIEICPGTEEIDPYVRITDLTETIIYRFENGQLGYGQTWLYYLTLLYGGSHYGLTCQQRLDACIGAVEIMGKAYELHARSQNKRIHYSTGQELPVPEKVIGSIISGIPRSKTRHWAL